MSLERMHPSATNEPLKAAYAEIDSLTAKLHAAEEREAKLEKVVEAAKAVLSMCKRGPHAESANVFILETYLSNLAGEG